MIRPPPTSPLFPYTPLFRSRPGGLPCRPADAHRSAADPDGQHPPVLRPRGVLDQRPAAVREDRKSTRLNSSHPSISYAVFCLKKKKKKENERHSKEPRLHLR